MTLFLKDPDAVMDYRVDWSLALGDAVTLAASVWHVEPLEADGVSVAEAGFETNAARARLAGGVPGHVYSVGNRVTLSDGSTDERSLTIRVENR